MNVYCSACNSDLVTYVLSLGQNDFYKCNNCEYIFENKEKEDTTD